MFFHKVVSLALTGTTQVMQQGDVAITSILATYGLTVKVQLRAACGIHAVNQNSTPLPTYVSSVTLADVLPQSGEPSSDRNHTENAAG